MADVIPPLVVDGSTLAIPRASATQNGYLSKEDFILFSSGGQVVPVTSFNTRTGEIVLLDDDVLAALGYVPINRSGDTMTGPLFLPPGNPPSAQAAVSKDYVDGLSSGFLPLAGGMLSGPLTLSRDPLNAMEAATRAYVLAHSGASPVPLAGEYILSDYGVSGSVQTFIGSINAGSNQLTLTTSSHDFQVGQGINILGAGNVNTILGLVLVSRITAIAGAVITIADNALTLATAQTVKHDDTVAFQTCINACSSSPTGGGTIIIEDGYYRINKGFSSFNSILDIPYVSATAPSRTVFFKAVSPFRAAFLGPISTTGVIIQTDLINTAGSMISGGAYVNAADPTSENITSIWMEAITWRTYGNPQINGVDLGMVGQYLSLKDVFIDSGVDNLSGVEPTHNTFGLRLPQNNFCTASYLNNVVVTYYAVGVIAGEMMDAYSKLLISYCKIGIKFGSGWHLNRGHLLFFLCPVLLDFSAVTVRNVIDFTVNAETGGSTAWSQPSANEFNDPGNVAYGKLSYYALESGVGTIKTISQSGMSHVTIGRIT
jgi:hypothetical protein